jgi:hypothetical protein
MSAVFPSFIQSSLPISCESARLLRRAAASLRLRLSRELVMVQLKSLDQDFSSEPLARLIWLLNFAIR